MAGGGSFLSFPAMLGMGVLPVQANATNTVALWPGQLASVATLWRDVRRDLLPIIAVTCVVGGIAGAEVLLHTRQRTFLHLIPWLILGGALIFGVSGRVSKWLHGRSIHEQIEPRIPRLGLACALFPACFYIGYFGAGSGFILMTDSGAVRHRADAYAERDEGGYGGAVEPVRDRHVHLSRRGGVALLRGVDGLRGAGRMGGGAVRAAHEWRCAAGDRGRHRLRDRGLLFLQGGAGRMTVPGVGIEAIGYVAATLTTVSFVPQLLRVVKLRTARDISFGMFLIFTAGTFAWLVYGVLAHSRPVWIANAVTFVLSLSILVLKLRFDHEATSSPQPAGAPRLAAGKRLAAGDSARRRTR